MRIGNAIQASDLNVWGFFYAPKTSNDMKTIYKYWKNSNTGDLIKSQEFTETPIKGIPVYWYRDGQKIGEDLQPTGYVEVSKKKFNRESK